MTFTSPDGLAGSQVNTFILFFGAWIKFKLSICRFCFDLVAEERPEVMTFQALSEEDRRQWLDTMDGREPVYSPGAGPPSANSFDSKFSLALKSGTI